MVDGKRMDCSGSETVSRVERSRDGQAMAMVICAEKIEAHALAQATDGLKKARDRIANDTKLSVEIRKDILKDLDREIERLSRPNKS